MEKAIYIDPLTSINNELYLHKIYLEYIEEHPQSQLLLFDFRKFKSINDTYGHNVGDTYLKLFAYILKNTFNDDYAFRLHGDEFCLLTDLDNEEIKKRLDVIDKRIIEAVDKKIIPRKFNYNAGATSIETSLTKTKEKADTMMYSAKANEKRYQEFDPVIWREKVGALTFLDEFGEKMDNDTFSYTTRQFFDRKKDKVDIIQLYTRDKSGQTIFNNANYQALREGNQLINFDVYNVKRVLSNLERLGINSSILLDVDYKSLCLSKEMMEYFKLVAYTLQVPLQRIILSINSLGLQASDYNTLIEKITKVKKLGFRVCLDKYDSSIGEKIWENAEIDFVRFNNEYWKAAMNGGKADYSLRKKVELLSHYQDETTPIFSIVESKEEHDYITSMTDSKILLSGNLYDKEKRLDLTRD